MNDNTKIATGNDELLTWAVENITEWNDDYTHLRSDYSVNPFYTKDGERSSWMAEYGRWGTSALITTELFHELEAEFSTKTPQVITKQEWVNSFHKTRLHTKPQTTVVDEYSSSCKPLQGHIHANLMAEYAEVALTHPEPWKEFESKHKRGEDWCTMYDHPYWDIECEYRRKPSPPKTMNIGGIVVEACPLESVHGYTTDCRVWTVRLDATLHRDFVAMGVEVGAKKIDSGKFFSTKEQAQAVADALNKVYNDALIVWKQQ